MDSNGMQKWFEAAGRAFAKALNNNEIDLAHKAWKMCREEADRMDEAEGDAMMTAFRKAADMDWPTE